MKINKKIISVMLLVSMLLPAFAACSESDTSGNNTQPSASNAQTDLNDSAESEIETTYFDDVLPAVDYNGSTFTILHRPSASAHDTIPYFDHESITGEPVDDAIFSQITTVEENMGQILLRL